MPGRCSEEQGGDRRPWGWREAATEWAVLTSSQESGSEGEGLAGPSGGAKVQWETAVGKGPRERLALAEETHRPGGGTDQPA